MPFWASVLDRNNITRDENGSDKAWNRIWNNSDDTAVHLYRLFKKWILSSLDKVFFFLQLILHINPLLGNNNLRTTISKHFSGWHMLNGHSGWPDLLHLHSGSRAAGRITRFNFDRFIFVITFNKKQFPLSIPLPDFKQLTGYIFSISWLWK